ncbi:hypothetical protein QL285_016172 [Trifolium repens]|nr:hypothetical protein QL285_016172 [Trifolium repens]
MWHILAGRRWKWKFIKRLYVEFLKRKYKGMRIGKLKKGKNGVEGSKKSRGESPARLCSPVALWFGLKGNQTKRREVVLCCVTEKERKRKERKRKEREKRC